jgi:hypothetical protein
LNLNKYTLWHGPCITDTDGTIPTPLSRKQGQTQNKG